MFSSVSVTGGSSLTISSLVRKLTSPIATFLSIQSDRITWHFGNLPEEVIPTNQLIITVSSGDGDKLWNQLAEAIYKIMPSVNLMVNGVEYSR
jgi:hypothetical protein